MQSVDYTPRFRNLSINGTPRFVSTSLSVNDKPSEEHQNSESGCFMCRQANVYIKPIGMQQERRVARRHPPPLTRVQIEELSEKKQLTKREVRLLLQCYFPEIKKVKYFQLHKYHSCCYDPKHLNLCKNHITAFQHERERYPDHRFHRHEKDEEHMKEYERNNGQQNRVSFVRIKIEPTKGIPTRFLGPTALPEPLADMLIKQVERFENKKKLPSFQSESQNGTGMYKIRRINQSYENDVSRLSEHLGNLNSDDDDDDSGEDDNYANTPNSNIRGYQGGVTNRSRMKYEKVIQSRQEKERSTATTNNKYGDLVVEDLDELSPLFIHEQNPSTEEKMTKGLKKTKRKGRTRNRVNTHHKPKLNHWEIMALDQSQQGACGCRHHVRRLEADQVVYDWCRCKDHLHRDMKERKKSVPPPPLAPPATPSPKPPKVQKKTVGVNATEQTTTELALAYDPTAVDYEVIQEVLYYRTASGRLIKPEITNAFGYNNVSSKGHNRQKGLLNKHTSSSVTLRSQLQDQETRQRKNQSSMTDSPNGSNVGSVSNEQAVVDTEFTLTNNGTNGLKPVHEIPDSSALKTGGMYGDDDDDDDDEVIQFVPPTYVPETSVVSPIQSPIIPMSMQKSSKPTYINQQPTPNFERETSMLANRRWFDQALGDQNLLPVHDGQYGLIAGTSAEQYHYESQLPDNDYVEPIPHRNRSKCTIS